METIVISLGGSVITTDGGINVRFLEEFRDLIRSHLAEYRFIIVCGGGKVCRKYISSLKELRKTLDAGSELLVDTRCLDWVGIRATRLNAELVRSIFPKELVGHELVVDPDDVVDFEYLLFSGGYKPGNTTDFIAVKLAEIYGAKTIINVSNVDYLYSKDPKVYADAKKIYACTFDELQEIVGVEHKPGINAVFDPVAVKQAKGKGFELFLVSNDLLNLENLFKGKDFVGTKVK